MQRYVNNMGMFWVLFGLLASEAPVHIVYAGDNLVTPGAVKSIRSVLRNTAFPDDVIFHYIGEGPLSEFPRIDFIPLNKVARAYNLSRFFNRHADWGHKYLNAPANYVRFVLAELFPTINKMLWLDCDTIVQCDVVKMARGVFSTPRPIIAAARRLHHTDPINFKRYGFSVVKSMRYTWNAGVFVVDLGRWRTANMTQTIERIVARNDEKKFYIYGSQPPMRLAIGDRIEWLSPKWNADGLGHKPVRYGSASLFRLVAKRSSVGGQVPNETRQSACVLHWTGKKKPWLKGGQYISDWK
tara:strand:+ start:234 stop:1127 length:894 start_codon:yes stop_codon:yes gene_type:complete